MEKTLKKRWATLEGKKNDLHTRNEKYARWTLPYLYPQTGQESEELDTDLSSIGARAVNHLSNKIIETLFPTYRPFLKLEAADDVRTELEEAEVPMVELDKALVKGEKNAIRRLQRMGHRTAATLAAKYLIVTGNTLLYYSDNKVHTYNLRNYCLVRDLSGNVIEIMTRDCKAFETLSEEMQTKLRESDRKKDYKGDTDVTLYTRILLKDGKYKVTQALDLVDLDETKNSYSKKHLPWIPLAWNLVQGEDYGRGHVEDYRGAFGAIEVLTQALTEGVISAAAIQYLVKPSSVVDIDKLNSAPNGTYHAGMDGDIVAIKSDKHLDFQQVRVVLEDFERRVAQAFLMGSEVTRDAERVTAVEIRKDAQELELSFGGIYSRFTEDWQEPVAAILLDREDITVGEDTIYPVIITGLDTLSRLGDIDNFHMFIQDMSLLTTLPEDLKEWFKQGELITWVGTNRGIDYNKFVKTAEEVQAGRDAEMQQMQQMQQAETGNQMVADAGKALAQEDI